MWTCTNCGREFKNTNQWHSCIVTTVDSHLLNKPDSIVETYNLILFACSEIGQFSIIPVKNSIQINTTSTFLSIKLTKKYIRIEFQSPGNLSDERIEKSVPISKNRVFHSLLLIHKEDVDVRLKKYIKNAYMLSVNE